MPNAHLQRPRFIWRNEYGLFYLLALLFGARKQIFITFGPWVLIRIFHQPVWIFAQLWIAAALPGHLLPTLAGESHRSLGRTAHPAGGFTPDLSRVHRIRLCPPTALPRPGARSALCLLYRRQPALRGQHGTRHLSLKNRPPARPPGPTLSLGISINHAVSMSVPALGGLLWIQYGHGSVFVATAGIAILMAACSARIRIPPPT
jgi:hypothetical protein